MSEKKSMVVPRSWNYVHRNADDFLDHQLDQNTSKKYYNRIIKQRAYSKRICYLFRNDVAVERCEYRMNSAICYNGKLDVKLCSVKTDFLICDALYTKMEDENHMTDFLVLVGEDQLMFWKTHSGDNTVISVPFRIERVVSFEFGILIERARMIGDDKSPEPNVHIYTLVHPFCEIFPVIYKDYHGRSSYAFSEDRISLIPSNYCNTGKYFLGFDADVEKHMIFTLRKCTQAETADISKLSNSFSLASTPASVSSFPNNFSHSRKSWTLNSDKSTPKSFRSAATNDTPLRRSFRNRARDLFLPPALPDLNATYASSVLSTQTMSILRNNKQTFRVFDLNGEESDELIMDFVLECVWMEFADAEKAVPYGTPKNLTPKSILTRRADGTPVSTLVKDDTPPRSVKFTENKVVEDASTPPSLPHKRALQAPTPVKPVSFNDVASKESSKKSAVRPFDFKNCGDYSNKQLLAILGNMVVRQRRRIIQGSLTKIADSGVKKEVAAADYIRARTNVMRYYARLMQKGIWGKCKSVKAYYALLLYKKEMYEIVCNEARSKASAILQTRAASRFFMTKDMGGQNYICYLPGDEESLKMLKWNSDKHTCIASYSIDASDAINITGSKMIAVLKNSSVMLYTGNHEVGPLVIKPFQHSSHQLLQFNDSFEKSIIIKAQHKRRLLVQTVLFDLDLSSSDKINKIFDEIFNAVPIKKAVKFYSTWYSIYQFNNFDNVIGCKKTVFLELPLMIEHFFNSLGLEMRGLTCLEIVTNLRKADSSSRTPLSKKERKTEKNSTESSDSDLEGPPEPMELSEEEPSASFAFNAKDKLKKAIAKNQTVFVSNVEGKDNYFETDAFAVFRILHRLLESCYKCPYNRKFFPLLLEPLYVFSKINGMQQYVERYSSMFPEIDNLIIEVGSNVVLPNSDTATAFNAEPMKAVESMLSEFKFQDDVHPHAISKRKLKAFPSQEEQKRWKELQWPTDIRSTNVIQMLDSSRQILIPVQRNDDEATNRDHYNLFLIGTYSKQVSKAFGRGAIGFRTCRSSQVSSMHIPNIELSGRIPPNHVFHEFPSSEITKPMNDWAEFMAGAAFTLSLTDHENEQVSYAWLAQWQKTHRSPALSSGCLFAYGLAGHFKNINVHQVHEMLVKYKKSFEISAIILGCAVSYRGTSNLTYFRTMATHIPSFLEATLVELKFDVTVQAASILGIGLLFQGTTSKAITNKITNEMAKETFFDGESEAHRYSYVLCCGIAVGLINLGRGVDIRDSEIPVLNGNYEIEERLLILLTGGKRILCTDFGRRNVNLCRVQRIGAAALGSIALPPSASACSTIDFAMLHGIGVNPEPNGMATAHNEVNRHTANSVTGTLTKESSTTRELSTVNIHLTSPAACIALGLMHLKTGDKFIIRKLMVPETLPEIETIRPDVLMLRTLCALMVDYKNVLPSIKYVNDLIPEVIRRFVCDIDYRSVENEWWAEKIDMKTVAESYYYIKCGIILAIGIRYASTYNEQAAATINEFYHEVIPLGKDYMTPKLRRFAKPSLTNTCAAIAVYALSLVMAGSGDLDTLRVIRQVRNILPENLLLDNDVFTYGIQTFCNSALGILFLGNARYGFSQSTEAVAMLLISSYPIMPQSICDQKHYFQPMRLFWSLATEYRHLAPVDDITQESVRMNAKITVENSTTPMILQLPTVLPPLGIIKKIVFYSENYKEAKIDMSIPEQKAQLEKCLKEYFGRFPVTKVVKSWAKIFDNVTIGEK